MFEKAMEIALSIAKKRNVKIAGIQLPDGLKVYSADIAERFEKEGITAIISGRASYGSCDIDEELMKEADVLFHFAHEPVEEVSDRVVFIPYRYDYDVGAILDMASEIDEHKLSLIATSQYIHKLDELKRELEKAGYYVSLKKGSKRISKKGLVLGCNFTSIDKRAEAVVFIGDGAFHPRGAAIYSGKKVYAISPLERKLKTFGEKEVQDFLKRRFALIAKAMDCEVFCVLASSKRGQKRLKLAMNISRELSIAGKKSYLVYFDEVNPENFPHDCLINTACPRIAYDDWKRFGCPVLSPQEAEILTGKRSWESYEMDTIF